jgi:hypothetical protein
LLPVKKNGNGKIRKISPSMEHNLLIDKQKEKIKEIKKKRPRGLSHNIIKELSFIISDFEYLFWIMLMLPDIF